MTPHDRFNHAGELLAEHGITLLFDTSDNTGGDACTHAVREHGDNIAHVHERGAHWTDAGIRFRDDFRDHDWVTVPDIYVSYSHNRPRNAERITEAFNTAGCRATWSGNPDQAVHVNLLS